MAKLLQQQGVHVIVALISPYQADRDRARSLIGKNFIEVFLNCPLEVCQERDAKGLYQKVRQGKLQNFTGISAPYEPPQIPDLSISTDKEEVAKSLEHIQKKLFQEGFPSPTFKQDFH